MNFTGPIVNIYILYHVQMYQSEGEWGLISRPNYADSQAMYQFQRMFCFFQTFTIYLPNDGAFCNSSVQMVYQGLLHTHSHTHTHTHTHTRF
jgi:hypothetical protein